MLRKVEFKGFQPTYKHQFCIKTVLSLCQCFDTDVFLVFPLHREKWSVGHMKFQPITPSVTTRISGSLLGTFGRKLCEIDLFNLGFDFEFINIHEAHS